MFYEKFPMTKIKIETYWNVNEDDVIHVKTSMSLKQKHIGM